MERAAQEQVAAEERLLIRVAELNRQRVDWEKQLATMTTEKEQEHQRYEELYKEYAQLQADLASQQTKTLKLDELTRERDSARDQLDLLRKEKSAVDATLAAMKSRMEEERKTTEERPPLHTKGETTVRKAAQTKIEKPTTERSSVIEQLNLFA